MTVASLSLISGDGGALTSAPGPRHGPGRVAAGVVWLLGLCGVVH